MIRQTSREQVQITCGVDLDNFSGTVVPVLKIESASARDRDAHILPGVTLTAPVKDGDARGAAPDTSVTEGWAMEKLPVVLS